jgi:uncharacterized protein YeeX (DUF496 family)
MEKELDNRFFMPLYDLLKEYIKSKKMVQEIYDTVKDICFSHGYTVNVDDELDKKAVEKNDYL